MNFVRAIQKLEIFLGGEAERVLFAGVDRFHRAPEIYFSAGADFDEDENIAVTADEIDLALVGQVIAVKDAVTVAAEEGGGDPLTIIPRLLCRRKVRRRRALVSGENRGDEWHKGREG